MYRMSGLGRNSRVFVLGLLACLALGGCCTFSYNPGNRCSWPSCSLEMGIVPMMGCGPCGSWQTCDPCYPFCGGCKAPNGGVQKTNDWGYDNSEYLSRADEGGSGASKYY